jgi:uroporphyrinogen III methyltransferase / synthase
MLAERGAEVIEMPVTRIEALDGAELRERLTHLAEYDWLVFTSQNGVRVFFDAVREGGFDPRIVRHLKVAAVGPATSAAVVEHGISLTVQPERFVAEAVLEAMTARDDVAGARVLYAAARGAREVIPKGLEARGAIVDRVDIYESVASTRGGDVLRARIEAGEIELITFTAGSAVRAFADAVGLEATRRVGAASIGPVTSEAARDLGIRVAVEATESTIPGLVAAIERYYTPR